MQHYKLQLKYFVIKCYHYNLNVGFFSVFGVGLLFSICLYIPIVCHEGLYTSLQEDKVIPLSVTSTPTLFQLLLPPSLPLFF